MNTKLTPTDIAAALSRQQGVSRKKAERLVRAFFEVAQTGLAEDKFVKIKGFGTFKVITVSERESVDVNTGERIQIGSHPKVTFTPDTQLKELVNKPFGQFQTVVLNDETSEEEFSAIDRQYAAVAATPQEAPAAPAEAGPSDPVGETPRTDAPEAVPQVADEAPQATGEALPSAEEALSSEPQAPCDNCTESDAAQAATDNRRLRFAAVVMGLAALAAGAYFTGYYHLLGEHGPLIVTTAGAPKAKSAVPATTPAADAPEPDALPGTPQPATQAQPQPEPQQNYPQLEGADHLIVGVLGTHTLQRGESLFRIAQKTYGDKEMARYIIFFNNIQTPDVVPLGAELQLPELKKKE